jgi:hypothetical protein
MQTIRVTITTSLLAATLLAVVLPGCTKKQAPKKKAPPTLDAKQISALLSGCEVHARKGDDTAFRGCLTKPSVDELDGVFTGAKLQLARARGKVQPLVERIAKLPAKRRAAKPLAALLATFNSQRMKVEGLLRLVGWKPHLRQIARAPKAAVEQVKVTGDRATFIKKVGKAKSTHHLARVSGMWKVDLKSNPDLGGRLKALRGQIAAAIKQLEVSAGSLEQGLLGKAAKRSAHADKHLKQRAKRPVSKK